MRYQVCVKAARIAYSGDNMKIIDKIEQALDFIAWVVFMLCLPTIMILVVALLIKWLLK